MVLKHCWHVMFVAACNLLEVVHSLSTCHALTHLTLIICKLVVFIIFVYACVFKNVNKLDSGMRVHQNTWRESVTGMEKGLQKRGRGSELS